MVGLVSMSIRGNEPDTSPIHAAFVSFTLSPSPILSLAFGGREFDEGPHPSCHPSLVLRIVLRVLLLLYLCSGHGSLKLN